MQALLGVVAGLYGRKPIILLGTPAVSSGLFSTHFSVLVLDGYHYKGIWQNHGYSFSLKSTDGPSNVDGGLEMVDGPRCFICGSYNHALNECSKPRDNAAVNNARKQHQVKRNQNSISRNPTRYYQDTPAGKFDGLRPGVLDAETRKLLGLSEVDPPPWVNRMPEIGYPPGEEGIKLYAI